MSTQLQVKKPGNMQIKINDQGIDWPTFLQDHSDCPLGIQRKHKLWRNSMLCYHCDDGVWKFPPWRKLGNEVITPLATI